MPACTVLQLLSADLTAGITSIFPMHSYEVLIEKPCRTFPYHPTTPSAPFQVQPSSQAHRHFKFLPTPIRSCICFWQCYTKVSKSNLHRFFPTHNVQMRENLPCFTAGGSTKEHFSMVCLFLLISGKAHISTVHELRLSVATVTAKCHKRSLCP